MELKKDLLLIILLLLVVVNEMDAKQFNVLDHSQNYDARCYFFTPIPACSGCLQKIELAISTIEHKNLNVEIVGFIYGLDNIGIDKLKKDRKWDFQLINDKLGLYHQYYLDSGTNKVLLFDNDGNLLSYFSSDTKNNFDDFSKTLEVIDFSVNKNEINRKSDYEILSTFEIESDAFDVSSNKKYRMGLYSSMTKEYYLLNMSSKSMIVVDGVGEFKRILKFEDLKKYHSSRLEYPSWIIEDSLIFLPVIDYKFESKVNKNDSDRTIIIPKPYPRFFEYNLKTDSMIELNVGLLNQLKINQSFYDPTSRKIYMSKNVRFDTIQIDSENFNPIITFDTYSGLMTEMGEVPNRYKKHDIIKSSFIRFFPSKEKNYVLHSYDDNIFQYDKNDLLEEVIHLENSEHYKPVEYDFPKSDDNIAFEDCMRKSSFFSGFLFDSTNKQFLILMKNFLDFGEVNPPPLTPKDCINYALVYSINGDLLGEFRLESKLIAPIVFKNGIFTYIINDNYPPMIRTILLQY